MNILVIIPARGGSKGIPRKNLRLLGGKPLLYYSIKTALSSTFKPDVYVSSDDDEILNMATKFNAKTFKRHENNAHDNTTLDPVIYECFKAVEKIEGKSFDLVITFQPTSPLLKTSSLDSAIQNMLKNDETDSIISAKDSTHLSWREEKGKYVPNYSERLNRQYLTKIYSETGGFLITKSKCVCNNSRIGNEVSLHLLSNGEEIDIDTYEDWSLCEYYLAKKKILFVVTGNQKLGLGHVHNTLILANDILNHSIEFLVDKNSELAFQKISTFNYPCFIQEEDNIIDDIKKRNPDLIINDRLDTSLEYMHAIKSLNIKTINFEDLGPGANIADSVVNAIYPEINKSKNHFYGQDYFILRDEFFHFQKAKEINDVNEILITFGGVDPNNYTKKVISSIYDYCMENNIEINVIAGFGYQNFDSLNSFAKINILKDIFNISDYMYNSDLIFTSAGRTIYEIASIGTPAIVLSQNERETTHFFAYEKFGFQNLGLGYDVKEKDILENFIKLVEDKIKRQEMSILMQNNELKKGRKTVQKIIQNIL